MIMTEADNTRADNTRADNTLQEQSIENLLERKQQLEDGLAAASMHGVEIPKDLLTELKETQRELARRSGSKAK